VALLLCHNVHADDEPNIIIYPPFDYPKLIYDFFAENKSQIYLIGIRYHFLGSQFGTVFRNNDFEDRFTNLTYIIPFGGREGIVLEVDDENILDAFVFIYDPMEYETSSIVDKFELKDISVRPVLVYRYEVLNELHRIRFQLNDLAGINSYLQMLGIKIKE
jgi:hypothetical protein